MNGLLRRVWGHLKGTSIRDALENLPEVEAYREFARTFTLTEKADCDSRYMLGTILVTEKRNPAEAMGFVASN